MTLTSLTRPSLAEIASRTYDVIVVGGGVTGAGVALDAATRGLSVLLVEKGDFASGTSQKSTKLVHGGLRYLQQMQFGVTLESVRERQLLEKLAPHMVWRVPFVIPMYREDRLKNLKVRLGLCIYDLMAGFRGNGRHQRISREEVLQSSPGIRSEGLIGGLRYTDCRTDDARFTLELIRTACAHGAVVRNYCQVTELIREDGQVRGVTLRNAGTRDSLTVNVRGKVVVNATGVWTQQTAELSGARSNLQIVPAKGIHIVLGTDRLAIKEAMIVPSARGDKRFCFAVPWYDSVLVGTTDTAYDGSFEEVTVDADEERYVLDALNQMFPDGHYTSADVRGRYAGLRPLIRENGASSTADVSRKHCLQRSPDGLVTIAGGKLTTYRRMAADTVDLVCSVIGSAARCTTDSVMIGGWDCHHQCVLFLWHARRDSEQSLYLHMMYGRYMERVTQLIADDQSLFEPVAAGHPYVMAQVVFAVREEAARTIDDVLSRRIRLTITDKAAAAEAAEAVSRVMARELAWTESQRLSELTAFQAQLARG